jgi:hypothetical protein
VSPAGPTCNACANVVEEGELVQGMCASCRRRLGLPRDAVPEVGEPVPCARCGHTEIVQAVLRQPTPEGGATGMGATYALRPITPPVLEVIAGRPLGVMVAHICRRCGKTELFTMNPQKIPIGPEYGTRLVKLSPRTPYRG